MAICLCEAAFAQETETISRTIFKLSPQHFTQNSLKGGVERFNRNHSASLAVLITGRMEKNENSIYGNGYDGLAGELQLRRYISPIKEMASKNGRQFHQGVYGGVYVQGGSYSGDFRDEYYYYDDTGTMVEEVLYDYEDHIGNWGGGFIIGYQRTLWQVVFTEVFIGGGLQFSDRITTGLVPYGRDLFYDDGITDPYYRGILPKIGLNVGIGL